MDPTGLVGMQLWQAPATDTAAAGAAGSGTLLLCVSPSKRYFRGIATHIENAVHGVMQVRLRFFLGALMWSGVVSGAGVRLGWLLS